MLKFGPMRIPAFNIQHSSFNIAARLALFLVVVLSACPGGQPADLGQAAARAEAYLRARGASLDPMMVLILDYLNRRFGLPWVAAQVERVRALAVPAVGNCATPAACGIASLGAFRRLLDPAARVTSAELAALSNTTDVKTAAALHCKSNGLPAAFLSGLEDWLADDTYDPPHAALALQWALEQRCLDANEARVAALRQQIADHLVRLTQRIPHDTGIEAVALLAYIGAWQRVRPESVQAIARAQRDNGSFGETPDAVPNDHTTTLALWVLLEATRPGKPVTWIVDRES